MSYWCENSVMKRGQAGGFGPAFWCGRLVQFAVQSDRLVKYTKESNLMRTCQARDIWRAAEVGPDHLELRQIMLD